MRCFDLTTLFYPLVLRSADSNGAKGYVFHKFRIISIILTRSGRLSSGFAATIPRFLSFYYIYPNEK